MKRTDFDTSEDLTKMWLRGLITNISNPKTAVFVASIFATALPAETNKTLGLAVIALTTSISLIWYLLVVYFFTLPIVETAYKGLAKLIDKIAGGFFILFGVKLALDR
jgi:threonine/homoserine/homoserine lactone efflux protein